jgi:phosphate transport system protein
MNAHTSRDFENELRELRARALEMGARCERIVMLALEALRGDASDLAARVRSMDRSIDADQLAIDALVLRILARRQPVATDLRFLTAAVKLVTDLERIGDEAVNIAERALERAGDDKTFAQDDIEAMAAETRAMLRDALAAFDEGDSESAEQVLQRDDAVDRRYGQIVAKMSSLMAQRADSVAGGLCVVRIAKYLERIADHATNVAERVIFIVRGDDVRHCRGIAASASEARAGGQSSKSVLHPASGSRPAAVVSAPDGTPSWTSGGIAVA